MSETAHHVVVMGVSGAGKSTVGRRLASELGVGFGEGDDFHSSDSIAKMSRGDGLTDDDRAPWLDEIGAWIAAHTDGVVVSCSALKRSYRDRLRASVPGGLFFVHLVGDRATIRDRVSGRAGHFMPESLVDSQFEQLEPLAPDELGISLDLSETVDRLVDRARTAILSDHTTR